ncbi:MAG: thioredoxin family protein [Bacteroidales bacterium]|nr:thioredoxin family protein [Bacteroidales bacterium]
MSRFSKVLTIMAAVMLMAACTPNAKISGIIESAPSSEVVVKLLDVNRYQVLDTVATDASGRFTYKVDVQKGQPEFVYVFRNDVKVASLLLEAGDKVSVTADTLGNYTIESSEESQKLAQVEKDHAAAMGRLNAIAARMENASEAEMAELRREIGKEYVDYYRNRVLYILKNSRSLTSVPVLFQNFGADLPVFSQTTDAIHFMNVSDSLAIVYPESKYVKALRKEAERRFGYLELETVMQNAQEIGYPDIELPNINAEKIRLSEVDAKVVMIYFWSAADANQKMFNLDVLKSLYEDYHGKGFEIYQIALDPDKTTWAQVVKQQSLPWINVCDGLGANSPYVLTYNIGALPAAFIIADGELVDGQIVDEKSLRKLLDRLTR